MAARGDPAWFILDVVEQMDLKEFYAAYREEALERLFRQVLRLCREAGLVKLGVVALDGTKVAANGTEAATYAAQLGLL